MAYAEQKPTVEKNETPMGGDTYSHPAFGNITLTQITGRNCLFGSDISHNAAMRITLTRAKLNRSLGRDWIHGTDIIAEFELSHAQFAQFITSQGNGNGTPVTLVYAPAAGTPLQHIPQIEPLQSKAEMHRDEIGKEALEQIKNIRGVLDALTTLSESGNVSKKALKDALFSMKCHVDNLPGNLKYAVKSGEEALENSIAHAKIEIESYVQMTAQRLGLTHISQLAQLENKEKNIG